MKRNELPEGLSDRDAEIRVLLALAYGHVEPGPLGPRHFAVVPAEVVRAGLALALRGGGDLVQLIDEIGPEAIAGLGGAGNLIKFLDNNDIPPFVAGVDVERLMDLAERRIAFRAATAILRGAVDPGTSPQQLRAQALHLGTTLPDLSPEAARQTSWSLAQLMTAVLPPPAWVVEGLLPTGLTILSGRPKSGKSFLSLQLAVAVASGTRFLDRPTQEGAVLYVALEDSEGRLQRRLRTWDVPAHLPLQIELAWPSLAGGGFGESGLEKLLAYIVTLGVRLVVIDTLSRAFMGGAARLDWNDQGDVTRVLAPLQTAAIAHSLAVVCVDHHRKPNGMVASPIDDLLGSSAKSGVLDTALGLYRERLTGKGTLAITGRDVEEGELALQWDGATCAWQIRGDARQVAAEEAQTEVLSALRNLGGSGTAQAIAAETGKHRVTVRQQLEVLVNQGRCTTAMTGLHKLYSLIEDIT